MSAPPLEYNEQTFYQDDDSQSRDASHPWTQHHNIPNGKTLGLQVTDGFRGRGVVFFPVNRPSEIVLESHANVAILNSKPTLELTAHGRLVGAVYHHWSSGIKIGVHPQGVDSEDQLHWVTLKKGGFTALDKSFSFEVRGQRFVLARMSPQDAGRSAIGSSLRNFKVIEEGSGNTVATYVNQSMQGREGTVTLGGGIGPELELYLIASLLMWREMGRRQQRTVGATV